MKRVALALLLAAALAGPAVAHEGHDHAEAAAPPPAAGSLAEASATTDLFELLVKVPADALPGGATTLAVFLADAATNAPLAGASIELEGSGAGAFTASAAATERPGVYGAGVTLPPPGRYDLVATVKHGGRQDLLVLSPLVLAAARAPAAPEAGASAGATVWVVVAASALFGLGVVAVLLARRRRRRLARHDQPPGGAALALLGALALGAALAPGARLAHAHGGEDHGAGTPAAAPTHAVTGAPVWLAKDTQFLLGVRTLRLATRDLPTSLEVFGQVLARTDGEATLFPPFTGRLLPPPGKPLVRPGAAVKKGETLAVVEGILGAPDRVGLATGAAGADARVAGARARAELAGRELARVTGLAGVVPAKRLDEAAAAADAADAELAAALRERDVLAGAGGLNRWVVTAPIDGVVVEMRAAPGEVVDPAKPLFRVVDLSTLWVGGKVYETDIAAVEHALRAGVILDAYPGRTFDAKLVTFGSVVDASTRTLDAVFEVPNPDGALRLGMFARIAIETGAPGRGVAVPAAAVLDREGGGAAVFVKLGPEDFVLRPVTLGRRTGRDVEVREGLAPGDRVVTEGLFPLKSAGPRPAPPAH